MALVFGKQDIAQELILMCNHLKRNTFLLQKETKNNTLLTQLQWTNNMSQLSVTSLQRLPVGNEKMRHPILLHGLFNFMFSCFPYMELCNCWCKILKVLSPILRHTWQWHDNKGKVLVLMNAVQARSHWHNEMRYILRFIHFSGRTYKPDRTWKQKLAVGNDNHLWQSQWYVRKYDSPTAGHSAVNKIIVTCSGTVTSKWYIQRKLKWY
jgi:hypothetical protein